MHQSLAARLASLTSPIRVGIIGAGAMGEGLAYQTALTPGLRCCAVADLKIDRAIRSAEHTDRAVRAVATDSALESAVRAGVVAVCDDGDLIARASGVDVVVEASSSVSAGAKFVETALRHGKHAVLMNAEIDLAFGPYFARLADSNGVTYTSCDGDQHGVIKRLWDEVALWGFEPVMAGNIKGFLNRYADPTNIIPEADKRRLDYRMCAAYTDGSKVCIEMALLANALGLRTIVPGMIGPRATHASDVATLFDLPAIHRQHGAVVDYVLGAEPGGGVFVVGFHEDPYQQFMMDYYKMGPGPYYVFTRAYHLCHVEAMRSIAEAVLDGCSLLRPDAGFRTNVYAYAKRNLRAGDLLDGLGGYACYGQIENVASDGVETGVPICLADDLPIARDIRRDERIALKDVVVPRTRYDWALFEMARGAPV